MYVSGSNLLMRDQTFGNKAVWLAPLEISFISIGIHADVSADVIAICSDVS